MAARKTTHHATAESKRAILEGVLSLAVEAGYEGTTMAAVARASAEPQARDRVRRLMVALFSDLGTHHPLSATYRRRLATTLY